MPFLSMLALAALLALGPGPARAAEFNDRQRSEIETIVRDYLLAHPELLQEVFTALEQRQAKAQAGQRRKAVADNAEQLFRSPRHAVLGNPEGRVTLVEFFDYNCGYCKRALGDLQELLKSQPDLKVVLKEFPVLGPSSIEAAQVSIAALRQDRTRYLAFHSRLLAERGEVNRAKALEAARATGYDAAALEKDLGSPEVMATIEESYKLANALGLTGTPSYVVGQEVVMGAVGVGPLKEKVEEQRAAGCAVC